MLITFERKAPQRSDASQNDHKSKGKGIMWLTGGALAARRRTGGAPAAHRRRTGGALAAS